MVSPARSIGDHGGVPATLAQQTQPSPQTPARRRGMSGSARSMIISMLVVLAGCAVWIAMVPRVSTTAQPVQNVPAIAREVGIQQRWDVAVPAGLGEQWVPVNVRLIRLENQPPTWHVGYRAPSEDFLSMEQTQRGDAAWVAKQTNNGTPQGQVSLDGATWQRFTAGDRRSLVRTEPLSGLRTVVLGEADWPELEAFAKSLEPTRQGTATGR